MNKVIIITGTRKGIGKELAQYFLDKENRVAGCSRGEASIEHHNYSHFELDIKDESAVMKMIHEVRKKYGCIDILINNAGIAAMNHLLTTPYNSVRNVFETNFFGTFLFTQAVSKVMIRQKFGNIVNFTTIAVPLNLAGEAIYAASKSAIESFTRIAAIELAEFGIRVNAVGPTPVQTDLIRNIPQDKLQHLLNKQSIHRFGTFKDILNVIDFFIREESEFITGQVIYLGGIMKG